MILAFILLSNRSAGSPQKSFVMLALGLFLSSIGMSALDAVPRFTFGTGQLAMGIDFLPIAMGLFGIAEVLNIAVETYVPPLVKKIRLRELCPNREEIKRS